MTPIESAARALSQDYWAGKCNAEQLAAYVDRTWPRYVGRVRLVLEAVRPVSVKMLDAGDQAARFDFDSGGPEEIWQAMIDAAMGDTQ